MAIIILDYRKTKTFAKSSGKAFYKTFSLVSCDCEFHEGSREREIAKCNAESGHGTNMCRNCKSKYFNNALKNKKLIEDYNILAKQYNLEFVGEISNLATEKSAWKCSCGDLFERPYREIRQGNSVCAKCITIKRSKSMFKGYEEIGQVYWGRLKFSAKNRGILFDLKIENAYELYLKQNGKCALSGEKIVFKKPGQNVTESTASLDRIDSSQGYIEGNIQWVHKDINQMKMDLDQDYFINMCSKVFNNLWGIGERRWNPDSPFYKSK